VKIAIARVYLRVSTDAQDLERQEKIIAEAKATGYYIAGVYREKASGARADRPELLRMVADLQPGEVVIAEKINRISRLPLAEAERLVASIRGKGAKLAIPGVVDLSDLAAAAEGVSKIVLEDVQAMLLRLALQIARDDYEDRRRRQRQHRQDGVPQGANTRPVAFHATINGEEIDVMDTPEDTPGSDAMWRFECRNALANVKIEGFEPDEAFMQLWQQVVDHEITDDEFLRIVIERAQAKDRATIAAASRAVA
jgi:DNA invertase Pin-like site-specific DNA recombinase